jgi:cytoskeletal protein CcmA (bactofilin family)
MSNDQQDNQENTQAAAPRQIDIPATPGNGVFQPRSAPAAAASASSTSPATQATQPVRSPSGFAGAYPGASSLAQASQPGAGSTAKVSSGRRLVISEGITMSGEIEACDHLVIEGTVEAALKGARVLDVAETGTFYGSVEIEEATVAGRFEGDIAVNGRLTIKSTGTVTGSIAYRELQVEAGATIDGKISPLSASGEKKTVNSGKQAKKAGPRNDNEGAYAGGAELPFAATAAAAE